MLDAKGAVTLFDVRFGKNMFWSDKQDRSYRGDMEFILKDKGILVVNRIPMESYLYSVVPSEMPAYWPVEALKAQAVAARSEALAKLGRHKAEGFDFCPEVHCQVYAGVEKETEITNLAVDETRGAVLYYKNKPVDAIYSSCCGGHSQDNIFSSAVETCWRGIYDGTDESRLQFPLSPLGLQYWLKEPPQGIFCDVPDFAKASNFRWVRVYTAQEMNDMVRALADIGDVRKIIAVQRETSGHISKLRIVGTKSSLVIERELKIRTALGKLRSSMFKIEVKRDAGGVPEQFVFYGGGWGHGVGMCQAGACGMALRAKTYRDILQHYYKDIEFRKMY
jgi:peptidoglycan hydrolase-like amidase